ASALISPSVAAAIGSSVFMAASLTPRGASPQGRRCGGCPPHTLSIPATVATIGGLSNQTQTMRFHSAVNDDDETASAVGSAIEETREALGDEVDVAFVFFTADHKGDAETIVERVWLELDPQAVVGCSAEGVIGADVEIERKPGLAILAASMPEVRIHPFHFRGDDWHDVLEDDDTLSDRAGIGP